MHLDSYHCVQCVEGVQETSWHLSFECPFSQACWLFLGINWNFHMESLHMITQARLDFGNVIFRKVFILACWSIWCHRNNIIFYNGERSFAFWRRIFEKEMKLVTLRVNLVFRDKISSFLSSL
ncbi:hypothetical protein HU200_002672 [Digitaria exilis]|uniref:Reverse transcriptase zinc-binding domain-containing protein n=1 Tax=Digitaria exilis TaxID=1010633 RepID=A0A835FVC0_9POAL|nr:hypothetical protein HU200_002672 [Digitaria exilis]